MVKERVIVSLLDEEGHRSLENMSFPGISKVISLHRFKEGAQSRDP